jgi:RNA polymerase-binding transcription factor
MSQHDSEVVASIEATLQQVDRALERLRDGSYRSCQVCGAPIAEAELLADPLLTNCSAHPVLS